MAPVWLKAARARLGFTQSEMADRMGLKLRAYQDAEASPGPLRRMHAMAAMAVEAEIEIQACAARLEALAERLGGAEAAEATEIASDLRGIQGDFTAARA